MSGVAMSQVRAGRPTALIGAVALVVATTLVGNVLVLFSGQEDVAASAVVIGGISIALHLVGAWELWNLRRWGWIMTLILNAFDFLAGRLRFVLPTQPPTVQRPRTTRSKLPTSNGFSK